MTAGAATALRPGALPDLHVLTVPAPVVDLARFLAAAREPDTVMWAPGDGLPCAGAGVAAELVATGPERFAWIERRAAQLFERTSEQHLTPTTAPPLRLFGGFAFSPGAASAPPWSSFGDARFVLPRWSYGHSDDGAWLRLVTRDPRGAVAAIERVLGALSEGGHGHGHGQGHERAPHEHTREHEHGHEHTHEHEHEHTHEHEHEHEHEHTHAHAICAEIDPTSWRELVDSIRAAIAGGRCEKIVAAHCKTLELTRSIDHQTVFARLGQRYADCHRFALTVDGAHFVGATPERLIRRRGCAIVTEALAGSIATAAGAEALLASEKDRDEQQLVVRAIRDVLAPLCRELDVPTAPHIRPLRHVLHLETPVRGILHRPHHVVDLVRALHPTPAVGGVPTPFALSWIRDRETTPRGWYAAPVGWFDAEGDGEFVVAIRSALLVGRRAHVYAGAGIVRDSQAGAELEETRIKQRALLDALSEAR